MLPGSVACYGLATLVFAISRSFALSMGGAGADLRIRYGQRWSCLSRWFNSIRRATCEAA